MADSHTDVLLAAAGHKKRFAAIRLVAIGFACIAVIALAVIVLINAGQQRETVVGSSTITISTEDELAPTFGTSAQAPQTIAPLYEELEAYSTEIRRQLVMLKAIPFFGEQALTLMRQLDELVGLYNLDPTESDVGDDLTMANAQARNLIDRHSRAVENAFLNLSEGYQERNLDEFQRAYADASTLAPADPRLRKWSDLQGSVPAYFSAVQRAERAAVENSPNRELQALEEIARLGFADSGTTDQIEQLRSQKANKAYEAEIARARVRLAAGDYQGAQLAAASALRIFPRREQARELAEQAVTGQKDVEVGQLLAQAQVHIIADDWRAVSAIYSQVLQIDMFNKVAAAGSELAGKILAYQRQLQDFIDRPLRLSDDEVMLYAKSVLQDSESYVSSSQSLRALADSVDLLIRERIVPRALWVESDGKARIRVQGVGYIEPTAGKSIQLEPGTYDFYANCKGHMTKIYKVIVPLDGEVSPVRIMCGESI